jgi:Ca2+-binding EF-hand superfamily protein
MNTRPKNNENKDLIKKVFKKYDSDGKQFIDMKDLKKFTAHLKLDVEDSVLELILKYCSSEGSNKISLDDFYNVMVSDTYH